MWAFLHSVCNRGLCLIKDACFPHNWPWTQTINFIWHESVTQHWVIWGTFFSFSKFWFYTLTLGPNSTVWCFQILLITMLTKAKNKQTNTQKAVGPHGIYEFIYTCKKGNRALPLGLPISVVVSHEVVYTFITLGHEDLQACPGQPRN